jgi:hypothetical protein
LTRDEAGEGEEAISKPIRGTFFGCCAAAGTLSAKRRAQSTKTVILLCIAFIAFFFVSIHSPLLTFFIAHLVLSVIYHADTGEEKHDLRQRPQHFFACFVVFPFLPLTHAVGIR